MIKQKIKIENKDINISFQLSQSHIDMMIDLYNKSKDINQSLYLGTWYKFTADLDLQKAKTIFNDLVDCNILKLEPTENLSNPEDRDVFATNVGVEIYNHFKD
jgi:hypothetical protein